MSDGGPTPESLAKTRREILLTMDQQDFNRWKHHPVTAAYLQYVEDMIAFLRASFTDVMEAGMLNDQSTHLDVNPHSMRGQLHVLRQLQGMDISIIHRFYGKEETVEEQKK